MTLADAVPAVSPAEKKPRRRAAAVAGVVGIGAVVGGGACAWQFWSSQGPQPAEALPASTLAYVAVDLAPTGGQKLAAFETLRKFPSLKKELGLGSQDDLRRSILDEVASGSDCDIKADDIESWAGERAALAVVPVKKPEMVVVVQVGDAEEAEASLAKIARSCDDDDFGYAINGDWAVLAESSKVARAVRDDARTATLAEDTDYRDLTGAAGDPGVVTLFAAPAAGQALLDAIDEDPFLGFVVMAPLSAPDPVTSLISMAGFLSYEDQFADEEHRYSGSEEDLPPASPEEARLWERMEHYDDLTPAEQKQLDEDMEAYYDKLQESFPEDEIVAEEMFDEDDHEFEGPELPAALEQALSDFSGLGGVARFDGGTLELEVVADPILSGVGDQYDGTDALPALAALPADTALAFGGGFADGWAEDALTMSGGLLGMGMGMGPDQDQKEVVAEFKKATGLTPADLEELGGESVAFVARTGFEKALDSDKPSTYPIAARVTGDAGRIEASLAKLRTALGSDYDDFIQSRSTDDAVLIGPSPAYLDELVDPEDTLGDSDRFDRALPDADQAVTITYADADAGDWLTLLFESDLDGKDIEPFDAAGVTVTKEGDQYRSVLRVTFD